MSTAATKVPLESKVAFKQSVEEGEKANRYVEKYRKEAMDDFTLLNVLNLFK